MFSRLGTLAGACAWIALVCPVPAAAAPVRSEASSYNVILIGWDTLRADRVGCLGASNNNTPNLDRLAARSFLFSNAASASSWTLPSFMSWFTSMYPSRHKITNKFQVTASSAAELQPIHLSGAIKTLAQALKENGYQTAAFTGGAGLTGDYGFNRGFDVYSDTVTFGGFDLSVPPALDWLKAHGTSKFFLFIHGYDTHFFKGSKSSDPLEIEWAKLRDAAISGSSVRLPPDRVRFWNEYYDRKVRSTDETVGRLLDALEHMPRIADKTILILAADHGEELADHGGFDHGMTLYEELIHVPLLIHIPGSQGRVIRDQVRTIDMMPTVLDLLGIMPDEAFLAQMQGVSLRPLLEGGSLDLDALSETDYLLSVRLRSLRKANGWKLIYDQRNDRQELYNLNRDPGERDNLIEKDPSLAYFLETELLDRLSSSGAAAPAQAESAAAAPFDLATLKGQWKARIMQMKKAGRLPIIDISSSYAPSQAKSRLPDISEQMDRRGIAQIAFSAELGTASLRTGTVWTDHVKMLVAGDPARFIPATPGGGPPVWPEGGEGFLRETISHVRKDHYPLMGEFTFRHYPSVWQLANGQSWKDVDTPINGEAGRELFAISEKTGIPFQIHYEIEDRLLPPLEEMLRAYPKAKVIWCHLAQIRYLKRAARYGPEYVRGLIRTFPNLHFDLSGAGPEAIYPPSGDHYAQLWDPKTGGLRPGWKQLIIDHPWHFHSALDLGPDRLDSLGERADRQRKILQELPPEVREIVAYKATWRLLFDEDL